LFWFHPKPPPVFGFFPSPPSVFLNFFLGKRSPGPLKEKIISKFFSLLGRGIAPLSLPALPLPITLFSGVFLFLFSPDPSGSVFLPLSPPATPFLIEAVPSVRSMVLCRFFSSKPKTRHYFSLFSLADCFPDPFLPSRLSLLSPILVLRLFRDRWKLVSERNCQISTHPCCSLMPCTPIVSCSTPSFFFDLLSHSS